MLTGVDRGRDGLGGAGKWGRVTAMAALVVVLGFGTAIGDDQWWPFGPMTMFGFEVDPNAQVHSLGVEADTVAGRRVVVPLGTGGIGLERAEIEGQHEQLVAEPKRLQAVAVAAARSLPHAPRYRTIYLVDTVQQLKDGSADGAPVRRVLATWQVVDPAHPKDLS